MISGVSAKDSVISVRIEVLFEIFVSLNQCFCVFVSILNMNVVIGDAMANQQFPTQFSGTLYWVAYPAAFSCGVRMYLSV